MATPRLRPRSLLIAARDVAALVMIFALVGCGGGGGGGGRPPPPTGTPPPPPSAGTLFIDNDGAEILPLSIDLSQDVLKLALTAISPSVDLVTPRGEPNINCGNGGSRAAALVDNDGDRALSVGDALEVTYVNCDENEFNLQANGTLTVTIESFDISPSNATIRGVVEIGPAFEVTDPGLAIVITFGGSFVVDFSQGDILQGEDILLEATANGTQFFSRSTGMAQETLTEFSISRRNAFTLVTQNSALDTVLTYSLDYDSEALGGTAVCTATTIGFADGSPLPVEAQISCSGASGSSVRVPSPDRIEVDPEGDGSFLALGSLEWGIIFGMFINETGAFELQNLVPDLPVFSLIANAVTVAADPTRNRVLVLTGPDDPFTPNALIGFDPVSRELVTVATLPDVPRQVVVSPDGAVFYVTLAASGSTVLRIEAATGTQTAEIDFPTSFAPRETVFVVDLDVSPIDNERIALALKADNTNAADVIIVDGAAARPNTLLDLGSIFLASQLSDVLFSADGQQLFVSANKLTVAALDADGVTGKTETDLNGAQLRRSGADAILTGGEVIAANSLVLRGRFLAGSSQFALSAVDANLFMEASSGSLVVWDRDTYLPVGTFALKAPFGMPLFSVAAVADTLTASNGERVFVYSLADLETQDDNSCGAGPVTTEEGAEILRINCIATDIAYEPSRDRVYLSIRELQQAVIGNSVATVNPNGGAISYAPVGDSPRRLAVAQDGNALFVAFDDDHRIARLDLTSQLVTERVEVPLSSDGFLGRLEPRVPLEITSSPIVPSGLALTFGNSFGSTLVRGLGYLQDGFFGANVVSVSELPPPTNTGDRAIEFEPTGELVTVITLAQAAIQRFAADATGLVLTSTEEVPSFFSLPVAVDRLGDEVFAADGDVLNTATGVVDQRFDLNLVTEFGARAAVLADQETNSVYFLINSSEFSIVARYELDSGALIGSLTFDAQNNSSILYPSKIIKAGNARIGVYLSLFGGVAVIDAADFE
ncbi:MAG: hypothetical protein AAGM16_09220 [Pseudomonadota bacterium]